MILLSVNMECDIPGIKPHVLNAKLDSICRICADFHVDVLALQECGAEFGRLCLPSVASDSCTLSSSIPPPPPPLPFAVDSLYKNPLEQLQQRLKNWTCVCHPFRETPAVWSNAVLANPEWSLSRGKYETDVIIEHVEEERRRYVLHNVHFADEPYLPAQLSRVQYGTVGRLTVKNDAHALGQCLLARGVGLAHLLSSLYQDDETKEVIVGDFNEPSHFDLGVSTPCSLLLHHLGFLDLWLCEHEDPHATWNGQDRIDFMYGRNIRQYQPPVQLDIGSDHLALLSFLN